MKKLQIIIISCFLIESCGEKQNQKTTTEDPFVRNSHLIIRNEIIKREITFPLLQGEKAIAFSVDKDEQWIIIQDTLNYIHLYNLSK